ncbi:hypothetical protein CN918_28995 [Priestia megaterium]|nr:hypothetical protein CN918_28995 [Priestia megaterium]
MKNKYEVTFTMVNGEIGHLVEAPSLIRARKEIEEKFVEDIDNPLILLADDLAIVKANVQYFVVTERNN